MSSAQQAAVDAATRRYETTAPAGSPEWWLYRLEQQLDARKALIDLYKDYKEGRHKLNFATSKFREVFGQMLAAVSDNWMPLVVSASVERLHVQGFRLGENRDGDKDAWRIWQENNLDLDSALAFTDAGTYGESSLLVWYDAAPTPGVFGRLFSRRSELRPRITVEHPGQMIVARAAGDRRRRDAALKKWCEDDGTLMATVYLPGGLYRYQRPDKPDSRWAPRSDLPTVVNPLRLVPAIPLVNDPHTMPCYPPQALLSKPHSLPMVAVGLGRSDLADVVSTVDQINKLVCDMLVASEVGAYRQRWATGLEVPIDQSTGKPTEPFEHAINRLWIAPAAEEDGQEVKFGEFSQTELTNFIGAIENRLQSLASRTRTPPHYLLGQSGSFPSGESLKATETGLVAKCEDKKRSYGESLEEAISIAFAILGDKRANITDSETDWATSESRSESEFVDSLVKKLAIGVPVQQLWEDYGYSPQQIGQFRSLLAQQALEQGLLDAQINPTNPGNQNVPPAPPVPPNAGA